MERIIFHIDVNNAYLSWTAVQHLQHGNLTDLRSIPAAIVGDSDNRRGIILAKSTPAKQYGILTGEPTVLALQKCPQLVCFPPDFSLYAKCSQHMFDLLQNYSDRLEQYSIDEGFLEYTGMQELFGSPFTAAQTIRDHIRSQLGFTVNIGISCNKLLAKMAGKLEKPNRILTLFPNEIPDKLWPLPIDILFMVGKETALKLRQMGISTIGALASYPVHLLRHAFQSFGLVLHAYANGIDDSPVIQTQPIAKSIGNSTTLPHNITDAQTAHNILLALSETVSFRLRSCGCRATEITVTLKTSSFETYSHQKLCHPPIDCTNAVHQNAVSLFHEAWHGEPLRLLGIRAGRLSYDDPVQLSFLEPDWEKQTRADAAMDQIRFKYGIDAVKRATFVDGSFPPHAGGQLYIRPNPFSKPKHPPSDS